MDRIYPKPPIASMLFGFCLQSVAPISKLVCHCFAEAVPEKASGNTASAKQWPHNRYSP